MNIVRGIGFFVAIVIALAVGNGIVNSAAKPVAKASLSELLVSAAAEVNRDAPKLLDSETRLDKVVAVGDTLRYHFTLVNYAAGELDPQILRRNIEKDLIGSVCTTREVKPLMDTGATLDYLYFGKNGRKMTQVSLSRARCAN